MGEDVAPRAFRRYANWLEVGFNRDEFVLDFGQAFDKDHPDVHTGIVTTPRLARNFLDTLRRSIDDYGRQFPDALDLEQRQ
jgi:hypothetical protein